MPHNLVAIYQHFRGICCPHPQDMWLCNKYSRDTGTGEKGHKSILKPMWDEGVIGIKCVGEKVREKNSLQICIRKRAKKHIRKSGRLHRSVHTIFFIWLTYL
jgi:hypothetical protein